MRPQTSSASLRLGMTVLRANPVTSMTGKPARESRSIIATLVSVSIHLSRLCSPSRGPTSLMVMRCGIFSTLAPCRSEIGVEHLGVVAHLGGSAAGDHVPFGQHEHLVALRQHDAH